MTNTPIIRQIPTDLVHQFLPLCRQYIEAALVYTDLSFDQAKVFLSNGTWMLLIATDDEQNITGAYTLAFANSPNHRTATIVTAGGLGLGSPPAFDQACEIARNHGATRVHVLARQSAARLYKRLGLVEKSVLMEKNLCQDL
jgi:hypothetical protein